MHLVLNPLKQVIFCNGIAASSAMDETSTILKKESILLLKGNWLSESNICIFVEGSTIALICLVLVVTVSGEAKYVPSCCTKKKAQATTLTGTGALVYPTPNKRAPTPWRERLYLVSKSLKITSFQCRDLKQKHFKIFSIYSHKDKKGLHRNTILFTCL